MNDKEKIMWECIQEIKDILIDYECDLVAIADSVFLKDVDTGEIMGVYK